MDEQEETMNITSRDYNVQDPTFLQYRLNPKSLIDQIELTITGKRRVYLQDENGNVKMAEEDVGKCLVNKEGATQIINWVTGIINSQTVQGNFTDTIFWNFLADARQDLAYIVIVNLYNWNISESDYTYLINSIMNPIQMFVSRTLENKERESYGGTFSHRDGNNEQRKKFQIN